MSQSMRQHMQQCRVTVWNEFLHEQHNEQVRSIYPQGIHGALKEHVEALDGRISCQTATLEQDEHGLSESLLAETDVLIWWGHAAHERVQDDIVERVRQQVLAGMGLIVLHSGHNAKVFQKLMGTNCSLKWREADEKERIWVVEPAHPIMEGIPEYFELAEEEMYGERFDIPQPDQVLALSWFQGGEVFRSACTFQRGHGKIFYFRPGHETFPTYHDEHVTRIIANACIWAKSHYRASTQGCPNTAELEPVPNPTKEHIL